MNLFKKSALFISLVPLLVSCGTNSIAGRYGFQMGKEKGTHFGLFVTLTDKYTTIESEPEKTNFYKLCELSGTISSSDGSSAMANIVTIIGTILGQEGDMFTVPAYYYKSGKVTKTGEEEIKIGIDFSFIKNIFDTSETEEPSDITFPELKPEMIEKLIYTTYNGNVLTLNIPVSQNDILYQLYWYGIDLAYNEEQGLYTTESSYGVHEIGTHPTAEDVTKINETYKDDHAQVAELFATLDFDISFNSYRDYHTLGMGLLKQN